MIIKYRVYLLVKHLVTHLSSIYAAVTANEQT